MLQPVRGRPSLLSSCCISVNWIYLLSPILSFILSLSLTHTICPHAHPSNHNYAVCEKLPLTAVTLSLLSRKQQAVSEWNPISIAKPGTFCILILSLWLIWFWYTVKQVTKSIHLCALHSTLRCYLHKSYIIHFHLLRVVGGTSSKFILSQSKCYVMNWMPLIYLMLWLHKTVAI